MKQGAAFIRKVLACSQTWSHDYCFAVSTVTAGTWQLVNIPGSCQEVPSGVRWIEIVGLRASACRTKAVLSIIGWWWDQAAFFMSHTAQSGATGGSPGGLPLSWPSNTQGCSMGRKLLGVWDQTDDMVCDRDSSFECDLSFKAVLLLSLSVKIYSRLQCLRGQRLQTSGRFAWKNNAFFFSFFFWWT